MRRYQGILVALAVGVIAGFALNNVVIGAVFAILTIFFSLRKHSGRVADMPIDWLLGVVTTLAPDRCRSSWR